MTTLTDPAALVPEWLRDEIDRSFKFHLFDLPILPQVANEALALCQSPDADSRQLAKVLYRDQALAGNVLSIANSPMFGASVEIKSLEQAASRVGLRRITEVVMMVATKTVTFEPPPEWSSCVDNLEKLSLVSALYAKEVAATGRCDGDVSFLAGLLHDMGWPAVLLLLKKSEQKHGQPIDPSVARAAGEAYHARVAVDLATKWKLSREVAIAIQHHEDWQKWNPIPRGAPAVALADQLARVAMSEFPDTEESVLEHPALEALQLDEGLARKLLDSGERVMQMAAIVG